MKIVVQNNIRKAVTGVVIITMAFLIGPAYAQSPQAVKYQGVARDNVGNELSFQSLGLRLSIVAGSPGGVSVYTETQNPTTNEFGLFNINIGNGTVVSGSFSGIDWGSDLHFIKVEMDAAGGTNYQLMGTSQLLSVPYALYADSAGSAPGSAPQTLSISGNDITISGGNTVTVPSSGSLWTQSADTIYYTGGNVGIGTALPGSPLEVLIDSGSANQDIITMTGTFGDNPDYVRSLVWKDEMGQRVAAIGSVWDGSSNNILFHSQYYGGENTEADVTMIVKGDGTVGIGTADPGATLEVAGDLMIVDGTEGVGKVLTSDAAGLASWQTPSATAPPDSALYADTAGFAYEADTANYAWEAGSADTAGYAWESGSADTANYAWEADSAGFANEADTANYAWDAAFADSAAYADTAAYALNAVWDQNGDTISYSSGNVGIGITSPSAKLHIAGNVKLVDGTEGAGKVLTSDAAGLASWQTPVNGDADWTIDADTLYSAFDSTVTIKNGQVGIGTKSPENNFEVAEDQGIPLMLATGYRDIISPGEFLGRKARGTMALPTAVQADDALAVFGGYGYATTGWSGPGRARMYINAAQNWTDSTQGAYIYFKTVPIDSTVSRERLRITDAGNVGIGTSVPMEKLHVAGGDIQADNSRGLKGLTTGGASQYIISSGLSNTIDIGDLTGWTGGIRFFPGASQAMAIDTAGNVGIGTTSPQAVLDVNGAGIIRGNQIASEGKVLELRMDSANNRAVIGAHGRGSIPVWSQTMRMSAKAFEWDASGQNRMVIDTIGNVGIGTTASAATLHVIGNAFIDNSGAAHGLTGNPGLVVDGASGGADIARFRNNSGSAVVTISSAGRMGVGVTPTGSYMVDARESSTTGAGVYGYGLSSTGANYGVVGLTNSSTGHALYGQAISASGINYGCKAQTGSASGYDFFAGGAGIDYRTSSSIRWKSNVVEIPDALVKVKALRGVYFDWDMEHGGGKHDVGFIAEEIGAVLPEIVVYESDGSGFVNGMDYTKVGPLLLQAIKEQQAIIEQQRTELETLKAEVLEIKSSIGIRASGGK